MNKEGKKKKKTQEGHHSQEKLLLSKKFCCLPKIILSNRWNRIIKIHIICLMKHIIFWAKISSWNTFTYEHHKYVPTIMNSRKSYKDNACPRISSQDSQASFYDVRILKYLRLKKIARIATIKEALCTWPNKFSQVIYISQKAYQAYTNLIRISKSPQK